MDQVKSLLERKVDGQEFQDQIKEKTSKREHEFMQVQI